MENFENREKNIYPEKEDDQLIKEIDPIDDSANQEIGKREKIKEMVEAPLVEACEKLYDKNIRTLSSSANRENIEGESYAYIIVDAETMSSENKEIALKHSRTGEFEDYAGVQTVEIAIPINEESRESDVRQKANEIVDSFLKQKAEWIPEYTLDYLQKAFGISPDDERYSDPKIWEEEEGYFYDEERMVFYSSREHYEKANEK